MNAIDITLFINKEKIRNSVWYRFVRRLRVKPAMTHRMIDSNKWYTSNIVGQSSKKRTEVRSFWTQIFGVAGEGNTIKKAHRSALFLDYCVVTSVTDIFYNPANKVTKLHTITTAYKA